jgi:hypothetical protein
MSEIKNLKVIRERIKHFKTMESKILKEDLLRDFGRITREFFDNGFEDYEKFKINITAAAEKYKYNRKEVNKVEVSGHQDKNTAD